MLLANRKSSPKPLTDQLPVPAREGFDQRPFDRCLWKSQMFGSTEACSTFERPERVRANALYAHGGICASDIAKCHGHGNAVTLEHLRIDDAESVALHVTASI